MFYCRLGLVVLFWIGCCFGVCLLVVSGDLWCLFVVV